MAEDVYSQLKRFLVDGKDWEEMTTPHKRLIITKIPGKRTKGTTPIFPKIAPKLLHTDLNGKPIRYKGIFIYDEETLIDLIETLEDPRVKYLIKACADLNGGNIHHQPQRELKGEIPMDYDGTKDELK